VRHSKGEKNCLSREKIRIVKQSLSGSQGSLQQDFHKNVIETVVTGIKNIAKDNIDTNKRTSIVKTSPGGTR